MENLAECLKMNDAVAPPENPEGGMTARSDL